MRKIAIQIFCLMLVTALYSQNKGEGMSDRERKTKMIDAHYLYLNKEYSKAVMAFKDLVKEDPDNANLNYLTGICFLNLPFENGRSISYLKKAVKSLTINYKEGSIKETKAPIDALYWLGRAYHINKGYTPAQLYYKRYRDTLQVNDIYNIKMVERQIESCVSAKELSKHPVDVDISNLGNYVNSPKADINPCVNSDGTMLVYTRIKDKNAKDTTNLKLYPHKEYQILESFCDSSGRWSKPKDINSQLNTQGNFKTLSLSSDGTELLLYRDDVENGGPLSYKNGNIYSSKKTGNAWSPAKMLNENINSTAWESHAFISPDSKELYFTSDRKGGFGGLDIYVSKWENGDWGPAKNLGPTINTPFNEETPVLLPDGKTLYFSSEGHYNMGGYDIFYSSKIDSLNWSEPINIGFPINSTDDNLFFDPIGDGSKAFYSVARNEGYITFGDEDIYELDIIPDSIHFPNITLSGTVSFEDLTEIDSTIKVTITALNAKTNAQIAKTIASTKTGQYSMSLRPGVYRISYTSNLYKTDTKKISLPKLSRPTPVNLNVSMFPDLKNRDNYYDIKDIEFNDTTTQLSRDAKITMEKLLSVLNENPGLYLEVVGLSDSKEKNEVSKILSIVRTRNVINYFIQKGIESSRFVSKSNNPLSAKSKNTKPDEISSKFNKYVEIRVIRTDKNEEITTQSVPLETKIHNLNRFSIALRESKEIISSAFFDTLSHEFGGIFRLYSPSGFLYYFGDFKNRADASLALNLALSKGFYDAKIVDYFFLNNLNNFDIINRNSNQKKYTIQLKAIDKKIIMDAKINTDIKEIKTPDGFYRYYYKEFSDLIDAEKELNLVVERGYPNAFILEMHD